MMQSKVKHHFWCQSKYLAGKSLTEDEDRSIGYIEVSIVLVNQN